MKKLLLSFLSLVGWGFSASAQSHINIELLGATYTTTPAVQFRVSWNAIPVVAGKTHNSKIWLWVDFRKIENNQPSGTWTRATVASPSPGTVAPETDKGFWLQGNSGSYSQIVTVALTNITPNTQFNWCAYASDCPPNMVMDEETYYFKGTPPFILKEADKTIHEITQTSMPKAHLTFVPVSITDKTECPGGLNEVIGGCPYTGADWYADFNHKCQQRTSGAKNWEAWIKDTRDDELYRIVLMPDNKWWLAQNVRYEGTGSAITYSSCTPEICGRYYTSDQANASHGGSSGYGSMIQGVCPNRWFLPGVDEWTTLISSLAGASDIDRRNMLVGIDLGCTYPNWYGWSNQIAVCETQDPDWGDCFTCNSAQFGTTNLTQYRNGCSDSYHVAACAIDNPEGHEKPVRCFRSL